MRAKSAAWCLILLLFTTSNADAKTGNELLADCAADQGTATGQMQYLLCSEYIAGVVDTWDLVGSLSIAMSAEDDGKINPDKLRFTPVCRPDGVTVGQIVDIVVKYLENHPEERHEYAHKLVLTVLIENFKCEIP